MPYAVRDHLEIQYELTGTGKPVLFLPGVASTRQVWGPVVRRLRGLPTLLMDHRDTGLSSACPGGYSIETLALDALAVMDHARVERAHIAGHSMGGAVAQQMALLAPQRVHSLVLINTWARTDVYSGSVMRLLQLLRTRLTDDKEFLHANTFVINSAAPLRFMAMEDIAQSILHYGPVQSPAAYHRSIDAALAFDAIARLPKIQCPALVIWGDEDKLFPPWHAAELLTAIPRAEDLRLTGTGHMAVFQAPDAIAAAIHGMYQK